MVEMKTDLCYLHNFPFRLFSLLHHSRRPVKAADSSVTTPPSCHDGVTEIKTQVSDTRSSGNVSLQKSICSSTAVRANKNLH